jgi:hypothetical protein
MAAKGCGAGKRIRLSLVRVSVSSFTFSARGLADFFSQRDASGENQASNACDGPPDRKKFTFFLF